MQHDSADRNLQNYSQHCLDAQEERFIRRIAKPDSYVSQSQYQPNLNTKPLTAKSSQMASETIIDKTIFSTMFSQIVFQERETSSGILKSPSQVLQDGLIEKVPYIDTCQDYIDGIDSRVADLIHDYDYLEPRFIDCMYYFHYVGGDAHSLLNKVDLNSEDSNDANQHLQRVFSIIQVYASLSRVFRLDLKNILPYLAERIKSQTSGPSSDKKEAEEILEYINTLIKQIEDELLLIDDIQRVCTAYLMLLKQFSSIHHRALLKIEEAGPHPGSEAKAYICVDGTVDGKLEPFNLCENSDLA